MRTDILERKEEIVGWISENQSKAFIYKQLKCKPETLNWWLDKMGIDYKGNQSGKGIKSSNYRLSAEEYAKSDTCRSGTLKKKLIEEKYLEDTCNWCGIIGEWNGKPITLELDHIDGDRYNNEFDNLRVLCPNCHSQTDTFRGRGNVSKKIHHCECGNEKRKRSKECLECSYGNRSKRIFKKT